MFLVEQTFSLTDFPKIFFLSFLEIVLSIDNIVVITMLVAALPARLHKKAFFIGSLSALVFRGLAIVMMSLLIQYQWVQIVAALYLLYLCFRYFYFHKKSKSKAQPKSGFWKTVILVELFDLVFALDSILAGLAFITSDSSGIVYSKIWIVYFGGVIGILGIRYLSHLLSKILHQFPQMQSSAHLMIGWIGCKLIYTLLPHPLWFEWVFWIGLVGLFVSGLFRKDKKYG
jgi:YkoY family integral membrane protein